MLQNVMEAQRIPCKRVKVVMTEKMHETEFSLLPPDEFQKLAEWNAAPVSRSAKMKRSLAKKKRSRELAEKRMQNNESMDLLEKSKMDITCLKFRARIFRRLQEFQVLPAYPDNPHVNWPPLSPNATPQ